MVALKLVGKLTGRALLGCALLLGAAAAVLIAAAGSINEVSDP